MNKRKIKTEETEIRIVIPEKWAGHRLDKVLSHLLDQYSRSRIQSWLDDGRIKIDGRTARKRDISVSGKSVFIRPKPTLEEGSFRPENIPLSIIYENDSFLVLDKPSKIAVHPGPGNWSGTILNGLLNRYANAATLHRAGIVHRLDKDTSGLMVVARTKIAQTELIQQLKTHSIKRKYLALVSGKPSLHGTIEAPIGRDKRNRLRMAVVQKNSGKMACTHFKTIAYGSWKGKPIAALCCTLETGRTHQIRVHLQYVGYPLLGDPLYFHGTPNELLNFPIPRQALHSWKLGLLNPENGQAMYWTSSIPSDIIVSIQNSHMSIHSSLENLC